MITAFDAKQLTNKNRNIYLENLLEHANMAIQQRAQAGKSTITILVNDDLYTFETKMISFGYVILARERNDDNDTLITLGW